MTAGHGGHAGHDHPHAGHAPYVPGSGAVLDIGGDVGALLVVCGPGHEGAEIELHDTTGATLTHTQVHLRTAGGGTTSAGLFPSVVAGRYRVGLPAGEQVDVVVAGGEVTTTCL